MNSRYQPFSWGDAGAVQVAPGEEDRWLPHPAGGGTQGARMQVTGPAKTLPHNGEDILRRQDEWPSKMDHLLIIHDDCWPHNGAAMV